MSTNQGPSALPCGERKGVVLSSMHPVIVADCTLSQDHDGDHHDQVEGITWPSRKGSES